MADDSLSAEAITRDLGTGLIGQKVLYYPSLTSTMEIARQQARQGAVEGTVIITDEQTAGRGRLKRAWLSPRGNIALTVIIRPDLSHLPSLIMLASLAVVHSIVSVTGLKAQIKWPNDVLINGKKVCGILIESDVQRSGVKYAIVGIGIDANIRLADFPEIQPIATSLSDELGREVSRLEIIRRLLVEMEGLYQALSDGGSLYQEWRDSLVTLGKKVRVTEGDTAYEGIAESVARDGSLLLRRPDGTLSRIIAGDVTLRF
ncbi:biotin--[acetyl-CoA-carboxylase] ligase [Chloroflexota bacterium]